VTILFLCWEYPPNGSGIGRYVAEMTSALVEVGHKVIVLTSRASGFAEEEIIGPTLILRKYERTEIRSGRIARLAVEVARIHQADWIEVADHWGEGASLLGKQRRPAVVVKMHYNDVLKASRYAQAWYGWQRTMIDMACLRQWRSIRSERFSLERADFLLAPCQRALDEARHEGLRLPKRCAVVPNPIADIPNWRNQESCNPTLLLVGRLDIGKGLPYLKPLLEKLTVIYPDLRLQVAGGDSYARGLGSIRDWFIRQLGKMKRHVDLLDVLKPAELDEAYRGAWVVVVPSRWDTFPQVVLESMIRAKPVVASPNGGMPEMLEGTLAKIADPESELFANVVDELLQSSDLRSIVGRSLREKALAGYSPVAVANSYLSILDGIGSQPPY
jgi:glycosyltransferase involved in cell wall biosynthesis